MIYDKSLARKIVLRRAKNAGIEGITPHALRRSFAVHYLKNGGMLNALQDIMGHNSIITTQKYLKLVNRETSNDYERTFGGITFADIADGQK